MIEELCNYIIEHKRTPKSIISIMRLYKCKRIEARKSLLEACKIILQRTDKYGDYSFYTLDDLDLLIRSVNKYAKLID